MATAVPLIDISQSEAHSAEEIRLACTKHGFFSIRNHGVSEDLMAAAMKENKLFFDQPVSEKIKLKLNEDFRGYAPYAAEKLDYTRVTQGDTKEGYFFGPEYPPGTPGAEQPLMGNNQWPSEQLPDFRHTMEQYYKAMLTLGNRLNRLLALALDLPAEAFDEHFTWPRAGVRLLHYSGPASDPDNGLFGAGAHTDYGMTTILALDGRGGLQIESNGEWIDVPPLPAGCLIVNLGDMFERWTNGLFKSTKHRVLHPGGHRYSIPFFFDPSYDTVVEVMPQCCSDSNPPRYPPTTCGLHLMEKLTRTYAAKEAEP